MSTISDVARVAGVSVATVSRALRGVSTVNPGTRDRVLRAAEQLDYVASPTAASLASGRTRVVGIVTPFMTRWFFATAISAVEKTLREHGFHALLIDLEADTVLRRRELTRQMLSKRVDGLVIINVHLRPPERELLDKLGMPVVAIGNTVEGHPLVRIDDAAAVVGAVDHLVELGHTRIAYVGAVPEQAEHRLVPWQRLLGFREGMARHGLEVPPSWVVPCDWSARDAAARSASLFAADPPTAVVAASDEMAIGVMATATGLGLSVPQDVSVIGVDDHHLAEVIRLSTVRQDVVAQGRAAATILLHQLLQDSTEATPALPEGLGTDRVLTMTTQVVPRQSTGRLHTAPPGSAPMVGAPTLRVPA